MKIKHILVPVDFSEYSAKALEYALSLTEKFDARITLVHAILLFNEEVNEVAHLVEYEKVFKAREAEVRNRIDPLASHLETKGVTVNSKVLRGFSAADALLEFIYENNFDLVVMGTHGRSGFKKWVYGSVAEKLVRFSPVPVLTIHKEFKHFSIEKILAPIDFSDYSKSAVKAAVAIAKVTNARLRFFHVVPDDFHPAWFAGGMVTPFKLDNRLKERIRDRMEEFVDEANLPVSYSVVHGPPDKEITEFAMALRMSLIVMGARGLSGLERFLVGSTTERVVRDATVPVLTVGREYLKKTVSEKKEAAHAN